MYWCTQLLGRSFQKAVVTRMQDLASEFSTISGGYTPIPSQREGETPSRTQHPARPLARRGALRGASAPVLGPKSWSPQLFSRCCAPACVLLKFCSSILFYVHTRVEVLEDMSLASRRLKDSMACPWPWPWPWPWDSRS